MWKEKQPGTKEKRPNRRSPLRSPPPGGSNQAAPRPHPTAGPQRGLSAAPAQPGSKAKRRNAPCRSSPRLTRTANDTITAPHQAVLGALSARGRPDRGATAEAQPKGRARLGPPRPSSAPSSAGAPWKAGDGAEPAARRMREGRGGGFPRPESAPLVLVEVGGGGSGSRSSYLLVSRGERPHPPLDRQTQRPTDCSPVPQGAGAGAGGGAKGASPRAASLPIGHITGLWLRLPRPLQARRPRKRGWETFPRRNRHLRASSRFL